MSTSTPEASHTQFSNKAPYSLAQFFQDHLAEELIAIACAALILWVLVILGTGVEALVFIAALICVAFIATGVISYRKAARFINEIYGVLNASPSAYLILSLVEEPTNNQDVAIYRFLETLTARYDQELQQAQTENRSYQEYIELWIHEIKTPIAAAKLILANVHSPEAGHLKLELERIESAVEQALYYARSLSLTNDYLIHEIDLTSCIKEACKRNSRYLIECHCTPSIHVSENLRVLADEPWLVFILSQVIINAATYGASEIVFCAEVLDSHSPNGRTVLEVKDNGCGIVAEDVPRVFDRGFTGSNGRRSGHSTGMGLYLVALMCHRMDIGVEIASEENVGTRLIFSFPHDRRRLELQRGA